MVGRMWREVGRWLARRPAALPLLVLGAVVIAVSAGPTPSEGSWAGLPDTTVLRWVLAGLVLTLATLGFLVLLTTRTSPVRGEAKRRSWVATVAAVLVTAALFSMLDLETELAAPEESDEAPGVEGEASGPQVEPGPGFQAGDLTALLAILGVAVALLIWSRRGGDLPAIEDEGDQAAIGAAVTRAREHLLDGRDPREAVLLAYRNLEQTLESLDLARGETETPTEHLTRALTSLSITDPEPAQPLLDLAALYARARYSGHRITAADQARAAESLERARRRLVGAAR